MPLFEVAVIQRPTKKEIDEGTGLEGLVLSPLPVVARDAQSAAIKAITGAEPPIKLTDRMEVLVRPFA